MTYPFSQGWERGYLLPSTAPDPLPPESYSKQMARAWVLGLAEGKAARDRLVEFRVARARGDAEKSKRVKCQMARDRQLKRGWHAKQKAESA